MDLRHLITLRAVAEERSFVRAAARIGYTQSAVSQQIAALERALGRRLVERPPTRTEIRLTAAGAIVLRHAEVISAEIAATRNELEELERQLPKPLRIGTHVSTGGPVLAATLEIFDPTRAEQVELVDSAADDTFVDLLQRGELDIAWVHLPITSTAVETTDVLVDPFVLVVAHGDTRASGRALSDLRAVVRLKMATLRASPAREHLRRFFTEEGLHPEFILESDDPALLAEFTQTSRVPSLVPATLAPCNREAFDIVRLPRIPPRRLGVAWCPSFDHDGRRSRFVDAVTRAYEPSVEILGSNGQPPRYSSAEQSRRNGLRLQNSPISRSFPRADDETRTHDLLHGKETL